MDIISVCTRDFPKTAIRAIRESIPARAGTVVALPTGRTMVPVYGVLRTCAVRLPNDAVYFAVDEYCWPDRFHPGTNADFFRTHWPRDLGLPEVMVPRADAPDPQVEIERHCAAIAALGGIDTVVLGIGNNGHIAFNEPGSGAETPCRVIPLEQSTRDQTQGAWPDPPARGMTLGMRDLLAARRVLLLAAGAEKQQILQRALSDTPTADVPASLLQRHPNLTVVCDEAAFPARAPGSPH